MRNEKYLFRGVVIEGEKAVCKVLGIEGYPKYQAVIMASQAIGATLGIGDPIWTNRNISEFQENGRTRFNSFDFVIPNDSEKDFEYMDFEIIKPIYGF